MTKVFFILFSNSCSQRLLLLNLRAHVGLLVVVVRAE